MSDFEQARELARAAERDISALRGMDDAAVFADETFGFHVQQAPIRARGRSTGPRRSGG